MRNTKPGIYAAIGSLLPAAYLWFAISESGPIGPFTLMVIVWFALTITPALWQLCYRRVMPRMLNVFGVALLLSGLAGGFFLAPLHTPSALAFFLAARSQRKITNTAAAERSTTTASRRVVIIGSALGVMGTTASLLIATDETGATPNQLWVRLALCIVYIVTAALIVRPKARTTLISTPLLIAVPVLHLMGLSREHLYVFGPLGLLAWVMLLSAVALLPKPDRAP